MGAARTGGLGLHRQPDLLPVDSVEGCRPPDRARLHLALGDRLVLVVSGDVRPEARGPSAVTHAFPALGRVLEGHRLRATSSVEGPPRPASRARSAGAR